jgi:hypothetical protein
MKSRLSITIEQEIAEQLQRASRQENRSLSNQIERIVSEWLAQRPLSEQIATTPGRFVGSFSREETYAGR